MSRNIKLALVQMMVSASKERNLVKAAKFVKEAASNGAQIVVLPECFNSPYGTEYFSKYGENLDGDTSRALSEMAKNNSVLLVGGSFPEINNDRIFNTCTIWDKSGNRVGIHRKTHLFDIDIPNKIKFIESDVLTAGKDLTIVDTEFGKIGVGICFDLRFPEPAMIAARKGAFLMIYPGAFNTTTGPLHWELLIRARALDNQIYVAACSPARDTTASYHAWGYSTIVDPMAKVLAQCVETETIVYGNVDLNAMEEARRAIYLKRRFDVYPDISVAI